MTIAKFISIILPFHNLSSFKKQKLRFHLTFSLNQPKLIYMNNRTYLSRIFLTGVQFLNRSVLKCALRTTCSWKYRDYSDRNGHEVVFFPPFSSFSFPSLSFLSARFFLQRVPHSRLLQFNFLHYTKSPAFHHRAARDFTSREMSFSLFTFFCERPHNYATLNVESEIPRDRFAFQTDHLLFSIGFRRASSSFEGKHTSLSI